MLELSSPQSRDCETVIGAFLPEHGWGERAVARMVRRLRRNKYPLLALEQAASRHPLLSRSPTWDGYMEAERWELIQQRLEFLAVKRAWAHAGIPSVLFTSAGTAPSFPYTSDNVDVLVPANHAQAARETLLAMGYVWLRNIDETNKWLFRKFDEGRSVSAIHVHAWVGWDVEFHERAIWDGIRRAVDDPEVMVPSREDAVLINAAHALYENKEIRLYDLEKIRSQWSLALDWEYMEGIARRRGWLDGLWFALLVCQKLERDLYGYRTVCREVVKRWEWGLQQYPIQWEYWQRVKTRPLSLPFRISFAFSKLLFYKKILRDDHDGTRQRVRNAVRTLAWGLKQKSGIHPQPGRLIAVSGMGGTGKTAHTRALAEAMTTSEVVNRLVWTRCGGSPLYRAVSRIAAKAWGEGAFNVGNRRGENHSQVRGRLWAWANALDLALTYQWKVRLPLLTGKVVIADRYVTDAAVEIAHRTGARDPADIAAVRALLALAPKPDAAYLLDAPAEIADYRSADPESVEDLRRQRVLYRRAADAGELHLLESAGDFGDVNDRFVRHALQEYEDIFATFTNGLFLSNPAQLNPGDLACHPQVEPPDSHALHPSLLPPRSAQKGRAEDAA